MSDDVWLEYMRSNPQPAVDETADELVSDAFGQYSSDGRQVQLLGYKDTSSFVLVDGESYTYHYVDGDYLCAGYASGPTSWPNVAANRLAVRVACNLDIDVPESPDDLAPVGESPATTEDSGYELETDDAGQTWEVCPDGSRTFVGGGL
jgi:hypothetical protein